MTTKMEAAMIAAGVNKPENDLLKALALWRNRGGTYQRASELLALAFDKGRGHSSSATQSVSASPPPDSGGQLVVANQYKNAAKDGAGHRLAETQPRYARPVHEPSAADKKASALVRRAGAQTVLDRGWLGTDTIPGGPRYADLRWRDLSGMAERHFTEGATHGRTAVACMMLWAAGQRLGETDPESKWIDNLPADIVLAISRATEAEGLKPMLVGALKGVNEWLQNAMKELPHA